MRRVSLPSLAILLAGFAFLYGPIVLLVMHSFSDSALMGAGGGWSLRWYRALFDNQPIKDAVWLSLGIAFGSASLATLLGTLAALALRRGRRFSGRVLFSGLIHAPLVMPEVVTGLAMLMLFVALGLERGALTVMVAHTTLAMCFVTLVVQARLAGLDPALEEAAADLGAPPAIVLLRVTVPMILPAMIAGFLLAFTLSMDDLVLASFASGPGASTLPMRVYSQVRLGVTPEINAISTLLIAAVTIAIVGASLVNRRWLASSQNA